MEADRALTPARIEIARAAATITHPMFALQAAAAALGPMDNDFESKVDAVQARGMALIAKVGHLVGVIAQAAAGWTPTDLSKLLVGRWNGEAQTATGTYDRTLVVTSVEDRNGQLVAVGESGGPGVSRLGSQPQPVQAVVETINSEIVLRIFTPERRTAVLTLQKDGKRLTGTMSGAEQVGRMRPGDDAISLRKVE